MTHGAPQPLPIAPNCPAWCTSHDGPDTEWNIHPHAITKHCTRTITAGRDIDGDPLTITLEAFASVDGDTVDLEAPSIRLDLGAAVIDRVEALRLAAALVQLVAASAPQAAHVVAA